MILIADSGSTKTTWALVKGTRTLTVIETRGMNPYFTSPDEMTLIIKNELLPRLVDQPIRFIHFYGSGCSATKNNALIHHRLLSFFPLASITVEHDILGAARSLFGKSAGIACILGTGSNSCFYDGFQVFSIIPSLGYLYGDEGAGSNLGKKLIEKYLKNSLPEELRQAFDRKFSLSLDDLLTALYNKPYPNRFLASFSFFMKEQAHLPFIHDIVYASFIEFIEAHITRYDHYETYPVGFVGSIAHVFYDILQEAMTAESITMGKILRDPLEGLVAYHVTTEESR